MGVGRCWNFIWFIYILEKSFVVAVSHLMMLFIRHDVLSLKMDFCFLPLPTVYSPIRHHFLLTYIYGCFELSHLVEVFVMTMSACSPETVYPTSQPTSPSSHAIARHLLHNSSATFFPVAFCIAFQFELGVNAIFLCFCWIGVGPMLSPAGCMLLILNNKTQKSRKTNIPPQHHSNK